MISRMRTSLGRILSLGALFVSLSPGARAEDRVYLGGNFGFASLGVSTGEPDVSKTGAQTHLKLLYSRYFESPWTLDLGAGWFHSYLEGHGAGLGNPRIGLTTDAFLLEVSPRWRMTESWQLGPVFNLLAGEDVSFSEGQMASNALFGGVRLQYELPLASAWYFRTGVQALTDFNVPGRQLFLAQGDFQIGFSFGSSSAPVRENQTSRDRESRDTDFGIRVSGERSILIELPEGTLHFDTASSELKPRAQEILLLISGYLKTAPGSWQTARIEGHSDSRGKLQYNLRLSKSRAEKVADLLRGQDVPGPKISVRGLGPASPIDPRNNPEGWSRNRRVEIHLDGVVSPAETVRVLDDLLSAHRE